MKVTSLAFRALFPTVLLLPLILYFGRALTGGEHWGLVAWGKVYLPFVVASVLANLLIALRLTWTKKAWLAVLRVLLYYFLPFVFYGVYSALRASSRDFATLVGKIGSSGLAYLEIAALLLVDGATYYILPFLLAIALIDRKSYDVSKTLT